MTVYVHCFYNRADHKGGHGNDQFTKQGGGVCV